MLLFGLLCAVWIVPAQSEPAGDFRLAPAFVPEAAAFVVAGLGAVLLLAPGRPRTAPDVRGADLAVAAKLLAVVGLPLLVMELAGYIAGGIILVAGLMVWMGERRPGRIALVAGTAAPLVWAAAWYGLRLPLP